MAYLPADHLVIFDGSNIFVRAFFGIPKRYDEDGTPVWAVGGFLESLRSYWKQLRPTHWVVAWDTPRAESWRRKLCPTYKGTRKESDPELSAQWPLVMQAITDLGVPALLYDGYEADDIIASATAWAGRVGLRTTIVSSDKDLVQLFDLHDHLDLISPAHGRAPRTKEQLLELHGAIGMQFRDIQAMQGDTADNIPGVPGIGKKKAAAIVHDIGLDRLIERAQAGVRMSGSAAKVAAHIPELLLSRQLVTLSTDIELPEDFDAFLRCRKSPADASEKIKRYVTTA